MKTIIQKIRKAAEIAQVLITELHASDPSNATFEQVGLLDGQAIVIDFINHGEWECALDHLLYMIHESDIRFPGEVMLELHAIAKTYGLQNRYGKENQESLAHPENLAHINKVKMLPKIDWIEIPEGQFLMGLSKTQLQFLTEQWNWLPRERVVEHLASEAPQRVVHVPTFYISRFPITNRYYREFVRRWKFEWHRPDDGETSSDWEIPFLSDEEDDVPVTYANWHMAQSFCAWLGARLPTSTEWEKAARGVDGRLYPWGNEWNIKYGNFGQRDHRGSVFGTKAAKIGSCPEGASPFGVEDAIGNSYEWTMTFYLVQRDAYQRQEIAIRGSAPDPEAIHPVNHRVTQLLTTPDPNSFPHYISFRPVKTDWQRAYWSGFSFDTDGTP